MKFDSSFRQTISDRFSNRLTVCLASNYDNARLFGAVNRNISFTSNNLFRCQGSDSIVTSHWYGMIAFELTADRGTKPILYGNLDRSFIFFFHQILVEGLIYSKEIFQHHDQRVQNRARYNIQIIRIFRYRINPNNGIIRIFQLFDSIVL